MTGYNADEKMYCVWSMQDMNRFGEHTKKI